MVVVELSLGRERLRWIERSEEPVRMYVPGEWENVRALIGPASSVVS